MNVAGILRFDIAFAKAYGALQGGWIEAKPGD
jgi:hypothetical protein